MRSKRSKRLERRRKGRRQASVLTRQVARGGEGDERAGARGKTRVGASITGWASVRGSVPGFHGPQWSGGQWRGRGTRAPTWTILGAIP